MCRISSRMCRPNSARSKRLSTSRTTPPSISGAPAVLAAAQSLATAAAAKKDEVLKALNDKWTALAGSVPEYADRDPEPHRFLEQEVQQKGCRGH